MKKSSMIRQLPEHTLVDYKTCEIPPKQVPRIEFGAGWGRQGQAIPTCGAGQVMTIEEQIINR